MTIYTLRLAIYCLVNSMLAMGGLLVWVLIWQPSNFGAAWLSLPAGLVLLSLEGWALATMFGLVGVRFRDLPQVAQLAFQALWYVSTVFIQPKVFRDAGVGWLVSYSPVNHFLQLFRAPLLEGSFPTAANWAVATTGVLISGLVALLAVRRLEEGVVFAL